MFYSSRSFILFFCTTITSGHLIENVLPSEEPQTINFYKDVLIEMRRQHKYDGLLIVQDTIPQDPRLQMIYTLKEPKIIMTNADRRTSPYKGSFNSEILAVVIMEFRFHKELWRSFVNTMVYMRQIRILMMFVNIRNTDNLRRYVLRECEKSKITNVILHFLNSSIAVESSREYFYLWPYPKYHFEVKQFATQSAEYFPINWRDMKGKTLITLPDQNVPRSFLYTDAEGQAHLSGFTYKLLESFTQFYNASYKLLYPPKMAEVMHFSVVENMTNYGILDMPMSVAPIDTSRQLMRLSYPIELTKWIIMVPCAKRMNINQVYEKFLTPKLFAAVVVFATIFSLLHTIIEKLFYNQMIWLNLLLSDKVIPGVLGQSFVLKTNSNLISLRLVYVAIFVMGLFMSTLISAHLQTLITSPPFYGQITTFEELRLSGKKILIDRLDMKYVDDDDYVVYEKMKGVIEFTDNTTMFNHYRGKFNTSYGYTVTSALWDIFATLQVNYAQKIFCASEAMNIKSLIPFAMPLENNSQYKESMDYFVHKIHASGLLHAWQLHVFNDLLKLKKITLRDSSTIKTYEDLREHDLLVVWAILIIGLTSSLLVFCAEIVIRYCLKCCRRK